MQDILTRVWVTGAFCAAVSLVRPVSVAAHEANLAQANATPAASAPVVTMLVPAAKSKLNVAAVENNRLSRELDWFFGGRNQRGWSLYKPLVEKLISAGENTPFHAALSRWQAANQCNPSGVLDRPTWSKMIATWQSRRIKKVAEPAADQLLIAPSSQFYDPARAENLRRVERSAYAAYQKMIAAAKADSSSGLQSDPRYLRIVSAHRSQAYQNQLRKASPNSGRAGLAKRSPHLTGRALDLYVGGSPVSTADSNRAVQIKTPAYLWLVEHAEEHGFYPYFYEPWHWEYRGE